MSPEEDRIKAPLLMREAPRDLGEPVAREKKGDGVNA